MKKSNVIIFAILAIAAAFFLWLWYFLQFNLIDNPLDLAVSVIAWAIILIAIIVISKMEKTRQERIRTVYVGEGSLFNSELGLMQLAPGASLADSVAGVLGRLEYSFNREDFPSSDSFAPRLFIRSQEFDGSSDKWSGSVVLVSSKEEKPFGTPDELKRILATL